MIASPLLASPNNTVEEVLTQGATAINNRFQKCYHRSNVHLLTDAIQQTGSGPQVQGYRFDLAGGGMAPFVATFHTVPAELTYILASRYGSLKTASLLPQDTSSLHVRYKPDGPNTYAVQILVGSPTQLAAAPTMIGTTPLAGPIAPHLPEQAIHPAIRRPIRQSRYRCHPGRRVVEAVQIPATLPATPTQPGRSPRPT